MPARPFFLPVPAAGGQRFCILHGARGTPRGGVVYVHPLAEEMNKARRMVALQAGALAQSGLAVVQIDLLGCGDSSGDFGDATWQGWIDDVVHACDWLVRHSEGPLWIWGLRAGCLLAVEAARRLDRACNFLFWQPPISGKPLLAQFMRLKVAGEALAGNARGAMEAMRRALAQGEVLDVAGYRMTPSVAAGLEGAALDPPPRASRVAWLELTTQETPSLSPVAQAALVQWQRSGAQVTSRLVHGAAFWQTSEIEEAPALLSATLEALSEGVEGLHT